MVATNKGILHGVIIQLEKEYDMTPPVDDDVPLSQFIRPDAEADEFDKPLSTLLGRTAKETIEEDDEHLRNATSSGEE